VRTPFLLSFAAVFLVAAAVLTAPPWAPAWAPVRTGAPTEAASRMNTRPAGGRLLRPFQFLSVWTVSRNASTRSLSNAAAAAS
jgi:hypothetical protein